MMFVLDTSVLKKSGEPTDPTFMAAVDVLVRVLNCHSVVLDHQDEILREYQGTALSYGTFAGVWWDQMIRSAGKIYRVDGRLTRRDKRTAVAGGCHPGDFMFLAVSRRSLALIVHEDSDYENPTVAAMGISAHRTQAALAHIPAN